MDRDDGFSIISVNSDEDEVVFQAGIPAASLSNNEESELLTDSEYLEPAEVEVSEQVVESEFLSDEPEHETDEVIAQKAPNEDTPDAYRRTTKEDLDAAGPLPKARIAIILAGLTVVVVMVVYFMVAY